MGGKRMGREWKGCGRLARKGCYMITTTIEVGSLMNYEDDVQIAKKKKTMLCWKVLYKSLYTSFSPPR